MSVFAVILVRVGWLQLVEGTRYLQLSQSSRLRLLPEPNPRGLILDRKGRVLANNIASFSIGIIPENQPQQDTTLSALATYFPDLDVTLAKQKIGQAANPFRPVVIKEGVDLPTVIYLLEHQKRFPSVEILTQPIRNYPNEGVLGNTLGYVGQVNPVELSSLSVLGVEAGDLVGRTGIEQQYNTFLQGEKGGRQVEVDAYGRSLHVISQREPLPGSTLHLGIDLNAQRIAREEMGDRKGVVLMMEPYTGKLLCVLSLPSFDPNVFANGLSPKQWEMLRGHPGNPLENRAIRGEYPPGSTFKLAVAAAGLEEGYITSDDTFFCGGTYQVGNRAFKCWKETGHGQVNLEQALVHSCDVYFYQLGLKVGPKQIAYYAQILGLGTTTGVDLPSEKSGFVPTAEWKRRTYQESWYPGDTANFSIGQGFLLTTPIQMLRLVNTFATEGYLVEPQALQSITEQDGVLRTAYPTHRWDRVPISSKTFSYINKYLAGVVENGTGWRAKSSTVKIAGKTGTAEVGQDQNPHSWFIAWAPADHPLISIVVLVENREEDISIAPQIAGKILTRILSGDYFDATQ